MTRQMLNSQTFVKCHQPSLDTWVLTFISKSQDGSGLLRHTQMSLPKDWNAKRLNSQGSFNKESFHIAGKIGLISISYLCREGL